MTDTSGDTASGGLTNDMPGIGNAPPSPGHVPSALGGLARMIFGGRPAPQAPPPMPFGRLGASQISQMGGRPNQPRWDSTTASLFLPKGADQPPANFTPFISSMPREQDQWGSREAYPNLPQSHELPGIAQGLSKFFGQFGGGLSPLLALGMGRYAGDYIKGVMAGQEYLAKQAKEKYLEYSMKLQMDEERRFNEYHDTVDEFFIKAGKDMSKIGSVTVNGQTLLDALGTTATQTGDKPVEAMINDGRSATDILDMLRLRDKHLQDLQKHNTKAAEQEEDDSGWKDQGGDQTPQTPQTPQQTDPWGNVGEATPTKAAAGAPAPVMVASSTNDPWQFQPDQSQAQGGRRWSVGEEAAIGDLMTTGQPPPSEMFKAEPHEWMRQWQESKRRLGQLQNIAGSGNSVPGSAVATYGPDGRWHANPQLNQYNKMVGPDVEQLLNGEEPAGGGQGGQGSSPGSRSGRYTDLLRNLAHKADPEWSQANFQLQRDFQKDNSIQNAIGRTNSMPITAQQLLDDLDMWVRKHPDEKGINIQMVEARALQNDPVAVKLMGDYRLYSHDLQQVVSNGKALQGVTFDLQSLPSGWASIESWRAVLKGHATGARSIANTVLRRWTQAGGRGLPKTLDPNELNHLTSIEKIYPPTGTMPGGEINFQNKRTGKMDTFIYIGADTNDWTNPANFIPKDEYPAWQKAHPNVKFWTKSLDYQ